MIKRESYLDKIRGFYNSDLVKVITGVRRSGKSVLLQQIIDELTAQGVPSDHIININFENLDYVDLLTAKTLDKYVKTQIVDSAKYYVFLDEIQNVKNFELAVNSLRSSRKVSLFITGSNSKLLSGELASHLSGRYVSFRVMPFTFGEVFTYLGGTLAEKDALFARYLEWGGMPQIYNLQFENEYKIYLEDLYNSIILKDIVERLGLKDVDLLNRLVQFVIENLGGIFSANSVSKYLKSEALKVTPNKIYEYLDAVESSLIISRVNRYDIRGKKVIQFYDKFYLADLGLMQLKRSSYEKSSPGRLENIVYNELIVRGFEVHIGEANGREIDFVVKNFNEITYIQVAETLSSAEVIEREFGAFGTLTDNYEKIVLSLDKMDYSRDGVKHINLVDWLLDN
jgi:predicted AAA+ superfamily ATPase